MGKSKRNAERRESSIKEFRAEILSKGPLNNLSGVSQQITQLSEIQKSNTDSLDNKLAAALKIKQLEDTGVLSAEDIEKERKRLGLSDGSSSTKNKGQTSGKDLLMLELQNETDPDRRNDLLHTINAVEQLEKSGNFTLAMSLATRPRAVEKKKSTFEEKFMEKAVSILLEEKKDPVDSLDKVLDVQKKISEMQPQSKGTDEFIADIEKAKKLGLVRDNAQSENEMHMSIEKMKIDNQYKIEEQKIDADKLRTEALTNTIGDVIGSALSAAGTAASKGGASPTSGIVRPETMNASYEANCAAQNCGAKILVTNVDQARDIQCPSCGQNYHLNSDDKKLYMIQDTPAPTSQPRTA